MTARFFQIAKRIPTTAPDIVVKEIFSTPVAKNVNVPMSGKSFKLCASGLKMHVSRLRPPRAVADSLNSICGPYLISSHLT